jgi:hypothetical protein
VLVHRDPPTSVEKLILKKKMRKKRLNLNNNNKKFFVLVTLGFLGVERHVFWMVNPTSVENFIFKNHIFAKKEAKSNYIFYFFLCLGHSRLFLGWRVMCK